MLRVYNAIDGSTLLFCKYNAIEKEQLTLLDNKQTEIEVRMSN